MGLAENITLLDQDIRTTSLTQGGEFLGQSATTADGRSFVYGQNASTSTALSPGKLSQGAVSVANHVNQTGAVYTAGTQQVTYNIGATLATQNQYQQGYLVVNDGTAAGQSMLIAGNTAAASSGSITVNLQDALYTATDATSKFSLFPHIYSACIISSTTSTAVLPTGYPLISIPASSYGWLQTGGTCSILANGTPGIGVALVPSATTAGAVDVNTAALFQAPIGYMLIIAVSTKYYPAMLTINPS